MTDPRPRQPADIPAITAIALSLKGRFRAPDNAHAKPPTPTQISRLRTAQGEHPIMPLGNCRGPCSGTGDVGHSYRPGTTGDPDR